MLRPWLPRSLRWIPSGRGEKHRTRLSEKVYGSRSSPLGSISHPTHGGSDPSNPADVSSARHASDKGRTATHLVNARAVGRPYRAALPHSGKPDGLCPCRQIGVNHATQARKAVQSSFDGHPSASPSEQSHLKRKPDGWDSPSAGRGSSAGRLEDRAAVAAES
jgi:hypothetical protein